MYQVNKENLRKNKVKIWEVETLVRRKNEEEIICWTCKCVLWHFTSFIMLEYSKNATRASWKQIYVYVVDVGFSNKVLGPGEFSVLENHKETDQFVCLGFVSWSSLIFFLSILKRIVCARRWKLMWLGDFTNFFFKPLWLLLSAFMDKWEIYL